MGQVSATFRRLQKNQYERPPKVTLPPNSHSPVERRIRRSKLSLRLHVAIASHRDVTVSGTTDAGIGGGSSGGALAVGVLVGTLHLQDGELLNDLSCPRGVSDQHNPHSVHNWGRFEWFPPGGDESGEWNVCLGDCMVRAMME